MANSMFIKTEIDVDEFLENVDDVEEFMKHVTENLHYDLASFVCDNIAVADEETLTDELERRGYKVIIPE